MDAATKSIVDIVLKIVAEPMGEQLKEIRALRRELDHAKREITYLRLAEQRHSSRRAHRQSIKRVLNNERN